jgi:hypothetical protein
MENIDAYKTPLSSRYASNEMSHLFSPMVWTFPYPFDWPIEN